MTNIYFESVLMAWSSIISNKMRSLLTMLGIIIGVAAVIALMSKVMVSSHQSKAISQAWERIQSLLLLVQAESPA